MTDPIGKVGEPVLNRFWSRVSKTDGCWLCHVLERWINAIAGARDYPHSETVAYMTAVRAEARAALVDFRDQFSQGPSGPAHPHSHTKE